MDTKPVNTKTVVLTAPLPFGSGQLTEMEFRPPKMQDLIACGEPIVYTRSAEGAVVAIDNMDAIAGYARELLVRPFGAGTLINHLELPDALAVKEVITDFFSDARRVMSAAGRASSSASSDGSAAPSSAP